MHLSARNTFLKTRLGFDRYVDIAIRPRVFLHNHKQQLMTANGIIQRYASHQKGGFFPAKV